MSESYNEILERMTEKFTELSGYEPERASDIGIRLKLLAGELFALDSEIDWMKKQMFPNTASGEQLELHALQRGLTRRRGRKAVGEIAFRLEMPAEYDVIIPAGTICTLGDGSLNYITTQEYRFRRGNTLLFASCEAQNSGKKYNVGIGRVNTIVTYFSVGISIVNSSSFTGGTDDETDEELRSRIAESYRMNPDGINAAYYEGLATRCDGIWSAKAFSPSGEPGVVIVVVGGHGEVPDSDTVSEARQALMRAKPLGINMLVEAAGMRNMDVPVAIKPAEGFEFSAARTVVEEAIRQFFLGLSVGEEVRLSALGSAILASGVVEDYSFGTGIQTPEINDSYMAGLGTITVTEQQ